jgi:pimeloyl-ACP methyl ester carboxylesterase
MPSVLSKDGAGIAFDREGQGPRLILVDGAMCYRDSGPARPLAKLLTQRFAVCTYDRRGRGESTDTAPYAVEREVEDIEPLIREAGGSAFLYGISSGAALALEAGARLSCIRKLVLYEAPFIVDATRSPRRVGLPGFAIFLMRWMPVWKKGL